MGNRILPIRLILAKKFQCTLVAQDYVCQHFLPNMMFAQPLYPMIKLMLTLCSIASIGLFSCSKDPLTTVNGTVVNKITGEPIGGATISFRIENENNQYSEYKYLSTNHNGEFVFTHNKPIQIYDVLKKDYLPKGPGADIPSIVRGEINDIKIELVPKDGMLKLNINNNSGVLDTIYVGIYSPFQEAEFGPSNGVIFRELFNLDGLTSLDKVLSLASEETIDIYWAFSPLPFDITTVPLHDSIYVTRNDTTSFTISF
jgi:hypothetical protein